MEILIAGLATGAIYGLMAVGVVMIFRATARVSFAQGEVLMIGAYAFWIARRDDLGPVLQIVLVIVAGLALGVLFYVLTQHLMPSADELGVVVGTLAVSIILITVVRLEFTDTPKHSGGWLTDERLISVGEGAVPANSLVILAVGLVSTIVLHLWFQRARTGQAVRAVAESPRDASLAGIPVRRMLLLSWGIGCAFATVSGLLLAPATNVYPAMGADILFKGFVAAAMGGFGSIIGAMVGGLLLGVIEIETTTVLSSDMKDFVAFAVLLAVLLIRPQGIFGRPVLRRV